MSWRAAMEPEIPLLAQNLQGHPVLHSTHLYCQWQPQRPAFTAQRQQNLLYPQHFILLSQQTNPSGLERRTVWIPNLVIGIFFWEAEDASLKHLWVWGLLFFGQVFLLFMGTSTSFFSFSFKLSQPHFTLGRYARVWDGSYRELLVLHFSIQPVRTGPHCLHWAIQGMSTISPSTCPGGLLMT